MELGAEVPRSTPGDATVVRHPPVNNLDQRGVTRPVNVTGLQEQTCDIGAYEANSNTVGSELYS